MRGNRLVVFYSWSGNTKHLAQMIAQRTDADLCELHPLTPYPADYQEVIRRAQQEIQEKRYPELHPLTIGWEQYKVVYIGTPNWCSTMAPPVSAFLYQRMPTDKIIVPFCTHGGGGAARIPRDVASYCLGCDTLPILALRDGDRGHWEDDITSWLKRIHAICGMLE